MQAYFIKLIEYDFTTNETMINTAVSAGSPDKAVKILAHLLAAQQVWLSRCQGNPLAPNTLLWPDWPIETLAEVNRQNHNQWIKFLKAETNFNRVIAYKSLKGDPFTNTLTEILTHLVNHGTHHRAQVGQQLKFAGEGQLPITDYIFYLRQPGV